jgi:lysophospholipase L1-like esterase
MLPRIFGPLQSSSSAEAQDESSSSSSSLLFCTVWLGANDAALPGEPQHVPLETYGDNLGKIISRIRARCQGEGQASGGSFPIILLTPPPVHEESWVTTSLAWREIERCDRDNQVTRQYGDKVKQVATEHDCHVVDTWELLSGSTDDRSKYLSDGLHLNESGNRLVYQGIMELLQDKYPALTPMEDGEGKWGATGIPLEEKLWQELV